MRASIRTLSLMPFLTRPQATLMTWLGVVCGSTKLPWMICISRYGILHNQSLLQKLLHFNLQVAAGRCIICQSKCLLHSLVIGKAEAAKASKNCQSQQTKIDTNVMQGEDYSIVLPAISLGMYFKEVLRITIIFQFQGQGFCDRQLKITQTGTWLKRAAVATRPTIGTQVLGESMSCLPKYRALRLHTRQRSGPLLPLF